MELENGEQRQTVTQEIDIAFAPLNAVRCALSESPVWDARRGALWYCDIQARTIFRHTMASGAVDRWTFPSEVGSLGLAASGRLVVALRHTVGLFDPDTGLSRRSPRSRLIATAQRG